MNDRTACFKAVFVTASLCIACCSVSVAQSSSMQTFGLSEVRLLKSPFLSAEHTDLKYMLQLSPDRLLAPYLREAGLKSKARSYGNWESIGLDGHTGGHYLTALAQMYASAGSLECKRRLDYMVSELARCQQANGNGYVGGVPGGNHMWALLKTGDFSEFNHKWVPWYNLHKLFAGLRDCYLLAGNKQAKEVFLKLTDWANNEVAGLSNSQMQGMLDTEQGGMNEVCADAYAFTGDKKYLLLAEKFCHQRILEPLEHRQDKLDGLHANTQIPKVIGFEKIAELTNDTNYFTAARFFWQRVAETRSISIGGNSVKEHFNAADNFMPMLESEQGPETCNSYNMLKLSKMLFLQGNDQKYIEFYERLLYNHILSSQHPVTGGFVYFTPIHPQHYRVYSTVDESFWCCVGTGLENHGKYGEIVYTHKKNDIFVNLFIPSILDWKKQHIKIVQQNGFPEKESTQITIQTATPKSFTVFVRKPLWVKPGGFGIQINGKYFKGIPTANGYIGIKRLWRNGDRIAVSLPMTNYAEYLPDHSQWVSFLHGPIVLAAPTDTTNMPGLFADDSRWGQNAAGPLYGLTKSPMLVGYEHEPAAALKPVDGKPLEFELTNIVEPSDKNLKLMPFYKVHDTRYMLYWPITAKDSIGLRKTEMAALDENYIKLAPRTTDQVSPGEQQPEKDHMLKYDISETGVAGTQHWRMASGYFSYRMRRGRGAKLLRVSYNAKTANCDFNIYADDIKIAHIVLDGGGADKVVNAEYPLPAPSEAGKPDVVIKFQSDSGSKTAPVYDVRLLRQP